ncbi:MAG: SRPBCC family protein [Acidimicrobiia bacterium]|nr:SRPBCC family protein [Acidimicrobiia bacterium]
MAKAIAATATINRPIDEVWASLTDWEHAPRWMTGIDSMSSSGDTEVGTRLAFRARGKDRTSEIVALEPGRSVTLRSVQGGVSADYVYRLREVSPEATAVSLDATCQTTGLAWRAAGPLIRFAMRRTDGGQLDALKAQVEGGNSPR